MKILNLFTFFSTLSLGVSTSLIANTELPKRAMKGNSELIYNILPSQVETLSELFSQGKVYRRIRSNTFSHTWEKEQEGSKENHVVSGLGGSLIYKSATLDGFDFTTGFYFTQGITGGVDPELIRSGKDVFSRYEALRGNESLGVIGEASIQYSGFENTKIIAGRQILSTFYVKPNDSKMIPNTFDGIVVKNESFDKTDIVVAYLAQQKLRDHTTSHSVIAVADGTASSPDYSQNDDSSRHQGLTVSALKAAGVDVNTPLITTDIQKQPLEDLKIDVATYMLPELLGQIKGEFHYNYMHNSRYTITTSARYIKQFDNGAGAIGGASIDNDTTGYNDPNSLESQMLALRTITKYKNILVNLGYSQVFDEADLVTPWRAFPTGGYTRSMARLNWKANTKSYRALLKINPNSRAVFQDTYIETSYLHTDNDESKGEFDEDYYYLGFIQNIPSFQDLQWRLRLGYTDTDNVDADNLDARFEMNYLF